MWVWGIIEKEGKYVVVGLVSIRGYILEGLICSGGGVISVFYLFLFEIMFL